MVAAGAASNIIGGSAAGAGNVISGNTTDGVEISGTGTTGNVVEGDYIGTDITGTVAIANRNDGVEIDSGASQNTIGGLASTPGTGLGNEISGNHTGVFITDAGTMDNVVAGNLIGTGITGELALPNINGVELYNGVAGTMIGGMAAGAGNLISGNINVGILLAYNGAVGYTAPTGTIIAGNKVGTDITGTLALANAAGVILNRASGNTVGGTVVGARNLISGNTDTNVGILGGDDDLIAGNYVGTDVTGTVSLGDADVAGVGIDEFGSGNTIGGTVAGAGNLIAGNDYGVSLYATDSLVEGNMIGTNVSGDVALPNVDGVYIGAARATRSAATRLATQISFRATPSMGLFSMALG